MHLFNFSGQLIKRYTEGDCNILADMLNTLFNYEIYEIVYKGTDEVIHVIVKIDDDLFMDVVGIWTSEEILSYWSDIVNNKPDDSFEELEIIYQNENSDYYNGNFDPNNDRYKKLKLLAIKLYKISQNFIDSRVL